MKHHQAASLFPMLEGEALQALADDICANGQVEPAVIFEDMLLDGRNREAACKLVGVPLKSRTIDVCPSPTAYVLSQNLHRRHLNVAQKAFVASAAVPMFAEEAKARERAGAKTSAQRPRDSSGRLKPGSPKSGQPGRRQPEAVEQAAKAVGAGREATRTAVQIAEAAPEIRAAVMAGHVTTVADAARLAKLSEEQRPEALALVASGTRPVEACRAVKNKAIAERGELVAPTKRYRVIYADPPWSYGNAMPDGTITPRDYYPGMSTPDICALPVKEWVEDNAVLFLWTTSPLLEESFDVIRAWGFRYKTSFVWDKIKHNMGHYNSVRHELLLVCTRGSCTPDVRKLFDSVVTEERGEHSVKPLVFYEIIETLYTTGRRIELFQRAPREGWDAYGLEARAAS